ncbi:CHASE3 domain-containing protein [Paenibacillus hexagrammi]|uniref:CHASE3 domain-containing protein n=1 Tax=Paenibacillus hexagrammi TaxID=2908839 RepID=A0ABY3SJ90_9BACL|nr:CHASE3 domain-containing protein [Paenibacillus sp. YPD9-1]UJF33590.1 CHASE3 domain-containing protein [Paenibacillus sp. YPD9-1]
MKPFSRSRISISYVIAIIALLALVSTSSYIASRNMERENNAIVNDAIPIAAAINNLLTDLLNQETGIRGYLLTADEQYLDPFTSGKDQLQNDLYHHKNL